MVKNNYHYPLTAWERKTEKEYLKRQKKKIKKENRNKKDNFYKNKDGYRRYLKSDWWRQRRKDYWSKGIKKCFCCGGLATTIHHKNYARLNKELDKDLIPICDKCHYNLHKLIKNKKATLSNAHYIYRKIKEASCI